VGHRLARLFGRRPIGESNCWRIVPYSDKRTFLGGLPFAVFAKGGPLFSPMPKNLKRITGRGDLHFITFCCYQRRPLLASARAMNLAVQILREVRARYRFALVGYVIMPEHLHLLISESASVPLSKIIQVFKQRLSRRMRARKRAPKGQLRLRFQEHENLLRRFWQRRYYDFNVYSRAKVLERLHYMHSNSVREKLVGHPGDWPWSSWCSYYHGEGLIGIDPWDSPSASFSGKGHQRKERPTLRKAKPQRVGHPPEGSSRAKG
jgi:putative transposase